ncbi:MAG: alpha-amylase family glycosyl hydrolase [Kiritimatiellae bacterium]|nr:alpha-amylase family glycosyl hydrolase [Kiritimatiellia bacterium]
MRIYNLFPRLAGRFDQWRPHLERAAELGFDWIYVNPIHPRGASDSLYAVADPFAVAADFAAPDGGPPVAQLRALLAEGRRLGLRWMADLVANHCAADSPIVRAHPAWFRWTAPGEVEHPSCVDNGRTVVWHDLARFDFAGTADRAGLVAHLRRMVDWLVDVGFDGLRCDAAYQVPRDIWADLIAHGRARRPDLLFVAETLGCTVDQTLETARAGFDLVVNSGKWWDFSSAWLIAQYDLVRHVCGSIGFPESHDTARLFEETGGSVAAQRQRYLFAALFSTGVLMPIGYEFGFRRRLHVVHTRPSDWEQPATDLRDFIRRTNAVKRSAPVFQEDGPLQIIPTENPAVLVIWKGSLRSRQEGILILNKDVHARQWFRTPALRHWVQSGAPLRCVSPENPLEFLPEPFEYELRPGEGIVLLADR